MGWGGRMVLHMKEDQAKMGKEKQVRSGRSTASSLGTPSSYCARRIRMRRTGQMEGLARKMPAIKELASWAPTRLEQGACSKEPTGKKPTVKVLP